MNSHPCPTLVAAGQVVGNPRHVARKSWIDATYGYEDPRVNDARYSAVSGCSNDDDESDPDNASAAEDIWRSLASAIRCPSYSNGKYGRSDIDWDCEKLSCRSCVPEILSSLYQ